MFVFVGNRSTYPGLPILYHSSFLEYWMQFVHGLRLIYRPLGIPLII